MYISELPVSLFDVIETTIRFNQGLNILAGENGTLKTQILRKIKAGEVKDIEGTKIDPQKIMAFSPKRNSERKALGTVINEFRRKNKNYDSLTAERIGAQLDDSTFSTYASLTEIFYAYFELKNRDGENQIEHMNSVVHEFNDVIQSVFSEYRISATWDTQAGLPSLSIEKFGINIPVESLSSGEQEVFSLILNLHVSLSKVDIILIDEPEIHLNWNLEDRLFQYFKYVCDNHQKQIIIATHSRVIFKTEFQNDTQYLVWDSGEVCIRDQIPANLMERIAGDAIEIIKLGEFTKNVCFVEDEAHDLTIKEIADSLGINVSIIRLGNSPNIKSMFKVALSEGNWRNSIFIVDGDNEGSSFQGHDNYIHLDRYCIENYWFEISVMKSVFELDEDTLLAHILEAIKENRERILKKNKYFEFLVDRLTVSDITQEGLAKLDASEIAESIIGKLGESRSTYLRKYITHLVDNDLLETVFPSGLISKLRENVV